MEKNVDYKKKYNGIRSIIEDVVSSTKEKIEDMIDNVNKKQNIKSEKTEELKQIVSNLKLQIVETRKAIESKAMNYASTQVYYMSHRELDEYYYGSRTSAEKKMYEKKVEELYYDEVLPIKRKLDNAVNQLEIEKKKELDDDIRKKTDVILSNSKNDLRSRLKTGYGVHTVGFIDLEKLVNMDTEYANAYINWITGELAGREIEQADGSFVERFNKLYQENRAIAELVSAQGGFFEKYVQNISDINDPSTIEFLHSSNYTGDFPTEEMSKEYMYEIQILEQRRQIEDLEARISKQEAVIVSFDESKANDKVALDEYNKTIKNQEAEIKEKDERIESQEQKIINLEQNMEEHNAEIEEKNQHIHDLTEQNESQTETIKTQQDTINSQEEQIRAITEQNEALLKKIEALESQKKSQTERAETLEKKVAKQDDIIKRDSRIIEKLRKSVSSLQGMVQNYCNMMNTIKGYIKDLYDKTEQHNSNIKSEKQKGFFTKLKEKLFLSKKKVNVNIEKESNELLGECNYYLGNIDTYYEAMRRESCNIGSYQIEGSIMEERARRIRQVNGDSELTLESVDKDLLNK